MGNRNNRKSGTEDDRRPYIIIAIAACAVILIAFGILLGHKLTKKDTPEETKKETTTTVTPEETKEKGVWLLSKEYPYLYGKPYLGREFSYDELGRMTQMTTYEADGSVSETEYYSYDLNGTRTECWIPAKGGECQIISLEDITGENISVRPYAGETYEEEFYKDGYIKEFRIYRDTEEFPGGPSKKTLAEKTTWEYDFAKNTVRRKTYNLEFSGETVPQSDLEFELDSDGRVVKCIALGNDADNFQAVIVYRYEGKRRIVSKTIGNSLYEETTEDGFQVASRNVDEGGNEYKWETFRPNVNSYPKGFVFPTMTESKGVWADGTETARNKIQFGQDGQPVRLIDLDTGAILIEYEYSSDGRWIGVKEGHGEEPPVKILNIKLDKNGNIVEYSAEQGYEWSYGAGARWEWIFVPAQEQ